MKRTLRIFSLLFLIAAALDGQAQHAGVDSLSWTINSFADLKSSSAVTTAESEFRTYQGSIDWLQESGGQVYTYTVESVDGSWPDTSQDGEITFHVSWHALTGTLNFKRAEGALSIAMDFEKSGANIMSLLFNVTAVNEIQ